MCSNILEKVSLASFDLVCGTPHMSKFRGTALSAQSFSLLRFDVFQYCTGPAHFVEKDKLERVTCLTNYSKLFELRVGRFAL